MRSANLELYYVLARRTPAESLRHIGAVHAPTPELAVVYAAMTYDEEQWLEVRIVLASCIISALDSNRVIRKGAFS